MRMSCSAPNHWMAHYRQTGERHMTQAKDNPATTQQGKTQSAAQSQPTSTGQQDQRKGLSRREDFLPSSPWTESPFSLMRRFSEEMDRLFGDVLGDFGT